MSHRALRLPVLGLCLLPVFAACGRDPEPPSPPVADTDLDAEMAILDLEPADGAVIRGTEAWIRWRAPLQVRGKLLWRRTDEAERHEEVAVAGEFLLARIPALEPGRSYEFIAENSRDGRTVRSAPRTFSAQGGLAFEPALVKARIARDYNQDVALTLRNTGKEAVRVAGKALAQFEDLPADVVGPGSVDEPADLGPGQSLKIRLVVAGTDATRGRYEIPVEAAGCFATARIDIARPRFELAFEATDQDPRTLARTVTIANRGETLSDLSVRLVPGDADVRLLPAVNHARLLAGESLEVSASPVLYLEFEALEVAIECRAGGQRATFPLKFEAPAGIRLLGVRTESTSGTHSHDAYCTNRPNTCSEVPGPEGTGPDTDWDKDPGVQQARLGARLVEAVAKYKGTPYLWNGKTSAGFDCSGLTSQVFKDADLPDPNHGTAGGGCDNIWNNLDPVDAADVRPGDVVIFDYEKDGKSREGRVQDHCGIVSEKGGGDKISWWHATNSGVNEANEKSASGRDETGKPVGRGDKQARYTSFISGYRRAKLVPPPGECAPTAPCGGETK